jgi:signal transduction histidine kinase/sensor domain CHASE-containing protein/CheY-like chemotaxis protein
MNLPRPLAKLYGWYHNAGLQIKVLAAIGVMFAVLLAALLVASRVFVMDSLHSVEQAMARNSAEQVRAALASVEQRLSTTVADWATWDDTYKFATAPVPAYIDENLTISSFKNLQINLMLFLDRSGRLQAGRQIDLIGDTLLPIPPELADHFRDRDEFLRPLLAGKPVSGLLLVAGRPLIVAGHAIVRSNGSGPAVGALLVGRWLDSLETNRLRGLVRTPFALEPLSALPAAGMAARAAAALTLRGNPDDVLIEPQGRTLLHVHMLVRDLHQEPRFLLTLPMERTMFRYGFRSLWYFIFWLIGITVVFAGLTALLIHRSITSRVQSLNRELEVIRRHSDPALRLALEGNDDIGRLAAAVNNTLAALVQAQESLRTSERKYRILFDTIRRGFALTEVIYGGPDNLPVDFRFIEANPAMEQITGIPRDRLVGKTIVDLYKTPDTFLMVMCRKVVAGGQSAHFEFYSHEFEKFLEIMMFATQPGLLAIMFTDISDRKKAEQEQAEQQVQNLQAQKLQAMGQLAGGIAHDFNNMLSAISGYAELIEIKFAAGNEEIKKYVGAISRSAKRMTELAHQLLTFAHKDELQMVPVNLHEVITEVVQILKRTLDKRITITPQLSAAAPTLVGDPTQLQNALMNLAINARDAMPAGGRLTFATREVTMDEAAAKRIQPLSPPPGRYLRVSVVDTGTGIDDKIRGRLFEPFFTTKGAGRGTGLGLASVFGTVAGHHGGLEVHTALGQGTTFHLYLPQTAAAAGRDAAASRPLLPRGSGTVMVVDDEAESRQLAADLLRDLGYTVLLAPGAPEALELFRANAARIDMVLLDMVMPGMGGYDCFQALKAVRPDVQVLIISGYAINAEVRRVLDEKPAGYLPKPLDIRQLAVTLHQLMPGKK